MRRFRMRRLFKTTALLLAGAGVYCVNLPSSPRPSEKAVGQKKETTQSAKQPRIPACHRHPPTGPLPETLPPSQFPAGSIQREAYDMAEQIKPVLYQQPCYCYCDRDEHHHSLLDCFVNRHASGCGVCMGEAVYAYQQAKKGKSPAEIREGIIRGDWREALVKH